MEMDCLTLKDLSSPRKGCKVDLDEDGRENDQKENICAEWRRSTPMKAESAVLLGRKAPTPDLSHITPIKHPDKASSAEPLTPTANLKVLISAASPDIRDREMRKGLFRPIENERETPAMADMVEVTGMESSCQFETVEEDEDVEKKPSRKQKSLGLLCQKFLALYPDSPPANNPIRISLDEVAASLGVERRRIYDIVNVLESLMIVGRIAKNRYTWHGRLWLVSTLGGLKRDARQQGYHLYMEQAAEARESRTPRGEASMEGGGDGESSHRTTGNRKDKSLRIMSQKFVMLFLVSRDQIVTLDVAAKVLIEESQDSSNHSKYKTKVRRLYDIANVLTSLGLIRKVHVWDERGKKPAFQWLGPVNFNNPSGTTAAVVPDTSMTTQPLADQAARKPKLARHASFNVTPTTAVPYRQVNSAPSTPHREPTGVQHQPVDYSRRNTATTAMCQLQPGNTTEERLTLGLPTAAPEELLPSSLQHHQHPRLAYLPSLSHPSVVMLYRPPAKTERSDRTQTSQRSPGGSSLPAETKKRKRDREEEEAEREEKMAVINMEPYQEEDPDQRRANVQTGAGDCSQPCFSRTSPGNRGGHPRDLPLSTAPGDREASAHDPGDLAQPSHYLYIPNSAGLNSLNFLLPASQPTGSMSLPSGVMPTLTLPYVLVPSSTLPHYPLLQQQGSDPSHTNLGFTLPAVMSPTHFLVGAGPYGLAGSPEVCGSPVPSPTTPEQNGLYGLTAAPPLSPPGARQTVNIPAPEPLTPRTPKETTLNASKAFFQTPGDLGNVVTPAPVTRKRGSAQRRLDIGQPPPS
ncbi:transcription factor E2F7 [Lampris incognitus]|uniref:transcription factor E2F7 n=1 Tax=Lampris incognitus TaxID=2546036 RepID=UPI0024B49585|nr:transcription factor E2F7 [Lampris incognitus]